MKIKLSMIATAILGTASMSSFAASLDLTLVGSFQQSIRPTGVSENGLATGRVRGDFVQQAVRYDSNAKTITPVGNLGGRAQGQGINSRGMVVGYSSTAKDANGQSFTHAFVTDGTTITDIGTLGTGTYSKGYAINENNVATGWSTTTASGSHTSAFSYDIATGTKKAIGTLGGPTSFGFGINNSGNIVGTSTTASKEVHGFFYDAATATMKDLGSLTDAGFSEAWGMNDKNQVVGNSTGHTGYQHAFMTDEDGNMIDLGTPAKNAVAFDINNHGAVVGNYRNEGNSRRAFYWDEEQGMINLSEFLSDFDSILWQELTTAYAINDNGDIVGRGRTWADKANNVARTSGFVISGFNAGEFSITATPVPLPASVFLLTPALGLLGWVGKKNRTA